MAKATIKKPNTMFGIDLGIQHKYIMQTGAHHEISKNYQKMCSTKLRERNCHQSAIC